MRKAEILTALGFIAFAVAVIVQARASEPGVVAGVPRPGFFPFWLALLLGIGGVLVLGQTLVSDKRVHAAFFEHRRGLLSVLKVSLTGIGMLVLTYLVGFYTAAIVYIFVYTRFVGRRSWISAIVLSLAIPIGSFYLVERVLQILLPRGIYDIIPFFG